MRLSLSVFWLLLPCFPACSPSLTPEDRLPFWEHDIVEPLGESDTMYAALIDQHGDRFWAIVEGVGLNIFTRTFFALQSNRDGRPSRQPVIRIRVVLDGNLVEDRPPTALEQQHDVVVLIGSSFEDLSRANLLAVERIFSDPDTPLGVRVGRSDLALRGYHALREKLLRPPCD